jgi:lipopolysaccharide assembly protein A
MTNLWVLQFHLFSIRLLITFVTDNTNFMSWKVITFLILTVLLVIFTVQNQLLLNIKFIHWEMEDVPVVYVLLFGLIFGFLLSMMIQLPTIMRLRRELKKVVKELEKSDEIIADKDEVVDSEGVSMGSDYKGGFFNE